MNLLFFLTDFNIHCWMMLLSKVYFSFSFNAFIIKSKARLFLCSINSSSIFAILLSIMKNWRYLFDSNYFKPANPKFIISSESLGFPFARYVIILQNLLIMNFPLHYSKTLYIFNIEKWKRSTYCWVNI